MSHITRHNYETYFVQYIDNELSPADRLAVKQFVLLHPDLEYELELLLQTKIVPDGAIVFDHKEELLQLENITGHTYQQWFLLYIDNELSANQKLQVENFATANPALQQELFSLQKTILPQASIVFVNKEILYRHEAVNSRNRWQWIAVAAAIVIAITSGFFIFNNDITPDITPIAIKKNASPLSTPATITDATPIVKESTVHKNKSYAKQAAPAFVKKKLPAPHEPPMAATTKEQAITVEENKLALAEKRTHSNLSRPEQLPPTNEISDVAVLQNSLQQNANNSIVTNAIPTPYNTLNTGFAANPDNNAYADGDDKPAKKGKLRGFFRKLTRNFEERFTANADDDGEKRLLVGGFAVKLK